MTSNILHHLNELKTEWRRNDFNLSNQQQEQYNVLLYARRERVKELVKEGRVSKGRKADD
jgi:hypothetical protein